MSRELFAERAWLGGSDGLASSVLFVCSDEGLVERVDVGVDRSSCRSAPAIAGDLCLPGFVNAHSHAFHRVLRGVSETMSGSFWTWRHLMYAVAARLDPSSYQSLASLVYAEMLLAGYTSVGEFHYLHHGHGGVPYDDPNQMATALFVAAKSAGIRMTLLDTCYLQAGLDGAPLEGPQLRFTDGSPESWAARVGSLARLADADPMWSFGVAAHSVRAVPADALEVVSASAATHGVPLHVHLSEQRAENEACQTVHGCTPAALLARHGCLGPSTTAVHATHLVDDDIKLLGSAACGICACPTTERDLGDGVGPFSSLKSAGTTLSIGSDSHAVIDPFEETRAIELNERLVLERRGIWEIPALLGSGSVGGWRSLGFTPAAGLSSLRVGAPADFVGIRLDSLQMAGGGTAGLAGADVLARVVFAGSPADVDTVVIGGKVVVEGGTHLAFGPPAAVAGRLANEVGRLLEQAS